MPDPQVCKPATAGSCWVYTCRIISRYRHYCHLGFAVVTGGPGGAGGSTPGTMYESNKTVMVTWRSLIPIQASVTPKRFMVVEDVMMVILTMGPALNPRLDGVVVETIVVFLTIWGSQ